MENESVSEVQPDCAGGVSSPLHSGDKSENLSAKSQYSSDSDSRSPSTTTSSLELSSADQSLIARGITEDSDNDKLDELIRMAIEDEEDSDEEYLSASEGSDDETILEQWRKSQTEVDEWTAQKLEAGAESVCNNEDSNKEEKEVTGESEEAQCSESTADCDIGSEGDEGKAEESDGVEASGGDTEKDSDEKSEAEKEKELERERQEQEDSLTEEERQERLAEAVKVKTSGNNAFKGGEYQEAKELYTQGLEICPLKYVQQRSIMLSNRAACLMKEEEYEEAVKDCSKAIDLQPTYIKAINRRADAYEKLEKLDDALKDHQKILELDHSQASSYHAAMRLEEEIKERNEKMKTEMLGKLKDLGNMVLRPFGLSTNNFQLQQDPNTGSYSVQFVQGQPSNGR